MEYYFQIGWNRTGHFKVAAGGNCRKSDDDLFLLPLPFEKGNPLGVIRLNYSATGLITTLYSPGSFTAKQ